MINGKIIAVVMPVYNAKEKPQKWHLVGVTTIAERN
jgi:hypothetical protein